MTVDDFAVSVGTAKLTVATPFLDVLSEATTVPSKVTVPLPLPGKPLIPTDTDVPVGPFDGFSVTDVMS